MYPLKLGLLLSVILIFARNANAGKLEDDVVKTAHIAFHRSIEPGIICSSLIDKCDTIMRALQEAQLATTNWSFNGFRLKLNSINKRQILLDYDAIVVVIKNLEDFAEVIHNMTLVHSQARYVIVEVGDDNESLVSRDCCRSDGLVLLQGLWVEKRIHRLIVLGLGCPGYALTTDVIRTNKKACMHNISTDDASQLYSVLTRRVKNMHGQVLRITMSYAQDLRLLESPVDGIPFEGVDATILREFVRYLNFTAEVTGATDHKPYAYTFPNGTLVGPAVDLTLGKADILFNGNFMYYLGSTPAQISKWYKEDALCVVIKKAGQVPKIVALFSFFSVGFVWGVLTMVWLAGGVLYGIRLVVRSSDWEHVYLFDSVASVTGFMMECPMSHKRHSNAERILLGSCSLWAVAVMGTYQVCLRGILTIPKDLKDIDTLMELDEAGYTIYVTSENLKTVFQAPGSALGERLVRRTVLVNNTLPYVLNNREEFVGTLTRKESSHRRVLPHEHLVSDCVRRSELSFFMRLGSPAAWTLNRMLSGFCEGGIIQYLRDNERREKEIQDLRLVPNTSQPGQFTLEDVQGAFLVLAVGTAVAVIIFGVELLEGRSILEKMRQQRRKMELMCGRRETKDVLLRPQHFFGGVQRFVEKNPVNKTRKIL